MYLPALFGSGEAQKLESVRPISQNSLYATIWVEYSICTVVMALRVYSQLSVRRRFALDDFVMVGAYVRF